MSFGVNDYPYRGSCPGNCSAEQPIGQCVAVSCQCVSFLCWRLANDLHVHLGPNYGNAGTWAAAARAQGFRVDASPAVHSVLCLQGGQQGAGGPGHVAVVLEVGPSAHAPAGHVFVENYNASVSCNYSRQVFASSPGQFIHFNDAVPVPTPQPVPVPVPVPVPTPTPPPPPPPQASDLLGPLLLVAGAAGLGWWALRRDPALSRRVRNDAGDFVRRARRGESGAFEESFARRSSRAAERGWLRSGRARNRGNEPALGYTEDPSEAGFIDERGRLVRVRLDQGLPEHSSLRGGRNAGLERGWVRLVTIERTSKPGSGRLEVEIARPLNAAQRARILSLAKELDPGEFEVEAVGHEQGQAREYPFGHLLYTGHRSAPTRADVARLLGEADAAATGQARTRASSRSPAEEEAKAKEYWGTTDDIFSAGWILPDGTMLDFKRRQGDFVEHHEVGDVVGYGTEEQYITEGRHTAILEALDRGWVRVLPSPAYNELGVEVSRPPTPAQLAVLRRELPYARTVALDVSRGGRQQASTLIEAPSPQTVGQALRSVGRQAGGRGREQGAWRKGEPTPWGTRRFTGPGGVEWVPPAHPEEEAARLYGYKPEAQVKMVMTPDQYFDAASVAWRRQGGSPEKIQRQLDGLVAERPELVARMRAGEVVDAAFLDVDPGDMAVVSQEGAHRVAVARDLGIQRVPVIVYARRLGLGEDVASPAFRRSLSRYGEVVG